MTLKEKFKDIIDDAITYQQQEDSFVQIADEFAIGFSIWCIDYTYHKSFDVWIKNNNSKSEKFTTKELLEIYKTENGL